MENQLLLNPAQMEAVLFGPIGILRTSVPFCAQISQWQAETVVYGRSTVELLASLVSQ